MKCNTCKYMQYHLGDIAENYVAGLDDPYPYYYCSKRYWTGDSTDDIREMLQNENPNSYTNCISYKKQN